MQSEGIWTKGTPKTELTCEKSSVRGSLDPTHTARKMLGKPNSDGNTANTQGRLRRVLVIGGIAQSLVNFRGPLLQAMVDQGYDVHACAGESDERWERELHARKVTFHRVNLKRRGINALSDLRYLSELRKTIRAVQPDVVLTYTIKPVVYGSLAAARCRVPMIAAMITGAGAAQEGTRVKEQVIAKIARTLYRYSLRHASLIFFQNADDEQLFRDRGLVRSGNVVQIPGSGVDLAHFEFAPAVNKPVTFLLIARLLIKKGIRDYAAAAAVMRQRYGDAVRFLLVGPMESSGGISEPELNQWVASGAIEYLGPLEDVREVLRQTSVFVLPSYYGEGTPRTVLEAMSMGRPVITTDAPGCRETVVHHRNGYLVPAHAPACLVNAMAEFVEQRELIGIMGARSRQRAEEKYDVHAVNRLILRELEQTAAAVAKMPRAMHRDDFHRRP